MSKLLVMPNTRVCKVVEVVAVTVAYQFKICDSNKDVCVLQPFSSVRSPKEWTVGILQQVGRASISARSWFTLVLQ